MKQVNVLLGYDPRCTFYPKATPKGSSITTSGITFRAISEFQDQLGRIKKRPKD
jgi:hypothetical protein